MLNWREYMAKILAGVLAMMITLVIINACIAQEYKEKNTGMIITKEIQGDFLNPKLVYHIKTPVVDYFDFVLAVDSSGSTGMGDGVEGYAIAKAVPKFIKGIMENETETSNVNFNLSVISWNDKIDFASLEFTNRVPSRAKFFSINKSTRNVDSFTSAFENYYDNSDETSGTNISVAIKASKDALDADKKPNEKYYKTKKFIILVAGNGEFKPCDPKLMNATSDQYEIFTIGLDISRSSALFDHLKELTKNKDGNWRFIGAGANAVNDELVGILQNALQDALNNATKSAVAYNVSIVESLYCYYSPDPASFMVNGIPINQGSVQTKRNPDGTTTIEFDVPGDLLKPNSEIVASFSANFNPGQLPITLTDVRKPITLCTPDTKTVLPAFYYNWFSGDKFGLSLI
jgi:hypothetical protein